MLPEGQDQGIDREVDGANQILLLSDHAALVGSDLGDEPSVFGLRLGRVPLAQETLGTTSGQITDSDASLAGRVSSIGGGGAPCGACHASNLAWLRNAELF